MGIIKDEDREQLQKAFQTLEKPVKLIMFTQAMECEHCKMTREMVEEVAGLSGKISAEIHDFVKDAARAKKYRVDKIPAIVVMGEKDYGIRFFGVPAGYEFTTLIEDILDVSRGKHGLDDKIVAELKKVDQPVHLQVMISPT